MTTPGPFDFSEAKLSFQRCSESYLLGRVHCDAKRAKKTRNRLRGQKPHPLRRRLFAASFLDSDRFQERSGNGSSFGPTKQPLQCRRVVAGDHLSDDSRSRTDRDHASVAGQRCLSIFERLVALSQRHDPETLSLADGTAGVASVAQASRSLSHPDECQATPTPAFDFRFGFHSADRLRKTRSRRCWLSSVQAGTQVVPSAALFRRTNERLLAWGTASRSCLYWGRSARSAGRLFCQDSHWCQTGYHSRRQGFLRLQDHRLVERKKGPLCHSRQADSACQTAALRVALPPAWRKGFYRRVLLSALQMGRTSSLRSGTPSPTGSPQRTTDSLQSGPLLLSSVCYQSLVATIEPVALLQRPGWHRTDHSRTQRRLSSGQDSDPSFSGQRNLFSVVAAGLQSGELVQTAVPARRVSKCHAGNFAQRYLLDARATAARRQPATTDHAHQRAP